MMRNISAETRPADEATLRIAPQSIEAEQALLGAILLNNEALDRIDETVSAAHFWEPLHGRIFQVLSDIIGSGRSATPVTLKPFFEHEAPVGDPKKGPPVSVPVYLGRLVTHATSVRNAKDYARTVRDAWERRQLIEIGETMACVAYEAVTDYPPQKQIEEAEAALFALSQNKAASTHEFTASTALSSTVDMIAAAYTRDSGLAGLSTGFAQLDRDLGGLAPSDLIILAGRPSMGKSALAANIAFNVAKAQIAEFESGSGEPGEVSFYSLEMSAEQLMQRLLAAETQISAIRMREGRISEAEFTQITQTAKGLDRLPVHIDTTGALSIGQMSARARRRKRIHNTRLIVVDYLQLMGSGLDRRGGNRVEEVSIITAGLKALAKELDVPVVALSQLSRQVENREDKRPQLSDLRESGSIEQDADVVLFVYREEYYVTRREPPVEKGEMYMAWQAEMDACRGRAEVIRGKHRHGATGITYLSFNGPLTKFDDWTGSLPNSGE
jgi:replicative DNA helicase